MDFSEALIQLKLGNRIKREAWKGYWFIPSFVAFGDWTYPADGLDGATLMTEVIIERLWSGGFAPANAFQEDLLASDWLVVA